MLKPFCDACLKPLDDAPKCIIADIMFVHHQHPPRAAKGLHFCNTGCMNTWNIKNSEPTKLIGPAQ